MEYTRRLISALIAGLLAWILWQYFFSPLRHVPGPFLAQFTDARRLVDVFRGSSDITLRALHRKYGSAVRLGPNCVSISDPSMIKTIYSTKKPLNKSDFYSAGDTVSQGKRVQTQFTTRNEPWHDYIVRPVRSAYSMSAVLKFEALMDKTLDHLVEKLSREYAIIAGGRRRSCPIGDLLHYFAWDVVGEVTFSERLGALDGNEAILQLLKDGERAIDYLTVVGQMPWLDAVLKNPVLPMGPPGFKVAADFAAERLRARLNSRKGPPLASGDVQKDYVDVFIDAEKGEDGEGGEMTRRQISWLIINTVAGSDTTAAILRAAVYYVTRDSDVLQKLTRELDQAATHYGSRRLDWKTCQQLAYLGAVVKETLRLSPSVGLPLERVVPDEGITLSDGRTLPKGTFVGISPRVVNHDEDYFGSDASSFVPSRWLRQADESGLDFKERVDRMKEADLTFGFGKRMCIGRNIAILEIYKCIARLFLEFEINPANPGREWTVVNGWFVKQYGIDVHLEARTS